MPLLAIEVQASKEKIFKYELGYVEKEFRSHVISYCVIFLTFFLLLPPSTVKLETVS